MKIEDLKKGFTHSGKFHSDDVLAAAFLLIINPNIKIERGYVVPDCYDGIVFDIGLGRFDHHQYDNEKRKNGIPYASLGKLWREFAPVIYGDYVYEKIDKSFIQDMDLTDNTGSKNSLALAIDAFNPLDRTNSGDKEFFVAVDFAKQILIGLINMTKKNEQDINIVKKIYDESLDKRIIVLDKYYSFHDYLPKTEALFVIYPNVRGGFAAQAVTKNVDTIESKIPFPASWLEKLPTNITFCHNSRFLISGKTLEDTKIACMLAMKLGEDSDW